MTVVENLKLSDKLNNTSSELKKLNFLLSEIQQQYYTSRSGSLNLLSDYEKVQTFFYMMEDYLFATEVGLSQSIELLENYRCLCD